MLVLDLSSTPVGMNLAEWPLSVRWPVLRRLLKACKLDGSEVFQLNWPWPELCAHLANLTFISNPVYLDGIPKDYHDFADVFSNVKADTLAPHSPYDLKITLENGVSPPQPLLYSLSTLELETLWEFLDEHLDNSFI